VSWISSDRTGSLMAARHLFVRLLVRGTLPDIQTEIVICGASP